MAKQPFYHTRPNKSIDRQLFLQTLIGLKNEYPISEYTYTGFGSYLFDDFRLLHETLNMKRMISLEKDLTEFCRAKYNCPYSCITIENKSSSDYLSSLTFDEEDEKNIFWLDYVAPSELGEQLADLATLLNQLVDGDIFRITLNANPTSLGAKDAAPDEIQQKRVEILKTRVPEQYCPVDMNKDSVTTKNYPITLLNIIKKVCLNVLQEDSKFSPNFVFPLFSTVYNDNTQMVTFMGIILDSHDKEEKVKACLKNYNHINFEWMKPCIIDIPPLSVDELSAINKLLPGDASTEQQLKEEFPFIFGSNSEGAKSYLAYYRFYPNFHQVKF